MKLEETKSLVLQVGKFYKTRDGRKAGPVVRCLETYNRLYPFQVNKVPGHGRASFTDDGLNYAHTRTDMDLVAEFVEPGEESMTLAQKVYRDAQPPMTDEAVVARFNQLVDAKRIEFSTHRKNTPDRNNGWDSAHDCDYRLVLAPAFEPFTTSEGYRVESTGPGLISIGCEKGLDAEDVRVQFTPALSGDSSLITINRLNYYTGRTGLKTNKGSLTWDDVELIVAAAKKVNSK